jgi:RNA polymerase sigma-70 factor, ECF subfamily
MSACASVSIVTGSRRDTQELDDLLVERCLGGDKRSFQALYERHAQRLFATSYRLMGNRSDAEDLVQVTFATAFRQLDKFRGHSRLYTWLCGIAIRSASNMKRSRQRKLALSQRFREHRGANREIETASPESALTGRETVTTALAAVNELPEHNRTAFVLHVWDELSLQEVADIMSASVQTTHARIKVARRKILERVLRAGGSP